MTNIGYYSASMLYLNRPSMDLYRCNKEIYSALNKLCFSLLPLFIFHTNIEQMPMYSVQIADEYQITKGFCVVPIVKHFGIIDAINLI